MIYVRFLLETILPLLSSLTISHPASVNITIDRSIGSIEVRKEDEA